LIGKSFLNGTKVVPGFVSQLEIFSTFAAAHPNGLERRDRTTMKTLQRLLLMGALLFVMGSAYAQSAINIKAGLIDRKFSDESKDMMHCGQSIGLDAIIEDSRFLFMPGLHYQRYSVIGSESRGGILERQESIHQFSLPLSIGTWVFADKYVKVRAYGGAHVNFIVGVDSNTAGINLDRVRTVHPGWQVGGQLMVWRLTADVRYGRDYGDVINFRDNSQTRGWDFLIGFAF
jgi:hypothetical protein